MQCKNEKKEASAGLITPMTVPPYFECVCYPAKLAFPAEFILDRLQFWRENLDNCAALHADQVIVVPMTEGMLIVGMLVVFFDLLDKAAFDKERKGSVNGSLGDLNVPAPHAFEESFRVKMAMKGKYLVENSLSLLGELEPFLGEEFPE